MRTCILIICISVICPNLSFAQESGKLRIGLDIGYPKVNESVFGLLGAIELKYNLRDNMNIGLKAEGVSFTKHKSYSANVLSFSVTYDYYFHAEGSRWAPFIGAGLGYYFCNVSDSSFSDKKHSYNNPTCFIRTGFEFKKFRTFFAYNLIRKPSESNLSNRNSDYISLGIGFYIGGGIWK